MLGAPRAEPQGHDAEFDVLHQSRPDTLVNSAPDLLTENEELPPPYIVLDFNDQMRADELNGACMRRDSLSYRAAPGGTHHHFVRNGPLGKRYLPENLAEAFHVGWKESF